MSDQSPPPPAPLPPSPPTSPPRPRLFDYRLIREGRGGTFIFDPKSRIDNYDHIGNIGTHICDTCVGVYFKLDSRTAFCAHMVVDNGVEYPKNLISTKEMGKGSLTESILNKLLDHGQQEAWYMKDPSFGEDLIICGPEIDYIAVDGKKQYRASRCVKLAVEMLFRYAKTGIRSEREHKLKEANSFLEEAREVEEGGHSAFLMLFDKAKELELEARGLFQKRQNMENTIRYSHYGSRPQTSHGFIVNFSTGDIQLLRTKELPAEEGDVLRFASVMDVLSSMEAAEPRDYRRVDERNL